MKSSLLAAITFMSIGVMLVPAQQAPVSPVVVELFTAEGCSSCPPADALLAQLVQANGNGHPEVIALGEHVDYWNDTGWTDRFSSRELSLRQKEYADRFKLDSVFTPQMVIDGNVQASGNNHAAVIHGIVAAAAQMKPAKIDLQWESPTRLHVSVQYKDSSSDQVVLALTEDGLTTAVKNGENRGRTLQHVAVVRKLREVGTLSKNEYSTSLDLPVDSKWNRKKMKVAVIVQKKNQGSIVGVASTAFPKP